MNVPIVLDLSISVLLKVYSFQGVLWLRLTRNQTDIIRHLLNILHLLFLHDLKGLLRRLLNIRLLRSI